VNRCGSWKAPLLPEEWTSSRYYAQASSGSHPEGCGLGNSGSFRAASVVRLDSTEGCLGRGCVSLNRRRDCDPGFGGSLGRVLDCIRTTAGDADGPRAGAFRSDDGTQRSGRFGDGSSNRALTVRHGAGGRHPRRGAPTMRSGRRRHAEQLAASREVVASREACDTRNAPES